MHPRLLETLTALAWEIPLDEWDQKDAEYRAEMMATLETKSDMTAWETAQHGS